MFTLILCTSLLVGNACNPALPMVTISHLTGLECQAVLEPYKNQGLYLVECKREY